MLFWQRIAAVSAGAVLAAGLTAGVPAYAAEPGVTMHNADTGRCLEGDGLPGTGAYRAAMTACTGSPTQQWRYSETDHTIRNVGNALCLQTGGHTGVGVGPCGDDPFWDDWYLDGDGRIYQTAWGWPTCMEDLGESLPLVGACDGQLNEVWERV